SHCCSTNSSAKWSRNRMTSLWIYLSLLSVQSMQKAGGLRMRSKWHTAYELVRYTGYSFLDYDGANGTIWLKNPKYRSVMFLNDLLTEEEMDHTTDSLFESADTISNQAGFDVGTIYCIHMAEGGTRRKRKSDGLKIIHR